MPILGIVASSISGNLWPSNSYESIATFTATGGETTASFTSIPSTYSSLQIRWIAKDTQTTFNGDGNMLLRFNGDTSSNYVNHNLSGNGTSVSSGWSGGLSGEISLIGADNRSFTGYANMFGAGILDIIDYASTSKYKTIKSFQGTEANVSSTSFRITLNSGFWLSTSAINQINLSPQTSYVAGTKIALYGLKGA